MATGSNHTTQVMEAINALEMALAADTEAVEAHRRASDAYTRVQQEVDEARGAMEAAHKKVWDADYALHELLKRPAGVTIGSCAGDPFAAAGVEPTEGPLAEHYRREREGVVGDG